MFRTRIPLDGDTAALSARSTRCVLGWAFFLLAIVVATARADYPIASHRYLADPAAFVHEGRVYLYCSNDDENAVEGGYEMKSIVCVSSADLKNWTDHGVVFRVPANASWAVHSWAPAVIARNGRFYLYFSNNASGIGVASSTSPTGPFIDAKGSALINASTPGVLPAANMWIFDPAVFIDDDGQAYLYFGGNGINNARVIRLNEDMISTSGSAVAIATPNFFEAAWMHKRGGLYYFSYSSNPASGLTIDYLTSADPMTGFVHRGIVAGQPPSNNNNNHHAIFELSGGWYHAFHNRVVATQAGVPTTYRRNLGIERLDYNADGTIRPVTYTTDGVVQLRKLDPYTDVEAETMNAQSGIETEDSVGGGRHVRFAVDGAWTKVAGVDFGSGGAKRFSARVASGGDGGRIEIRLDSATGPLVGMCEAGATGGGQNWARISCAVAGATGVHDVYLKFKAGSSTGLNVDSWRFERAEAGSEEEAARFMGIAARAYCGPDNGVTIGGFVVSGSQPKQVLLRAVGPSLTAQGIKADEVLTNPKIDLHDALNGNALIAGNDDWGTNANADDIRTTGARIGAAPFDVSDTTSSALLVTLAPGVYSFVARGQGRVGGIVLIEVYDADPEVSGVTLTGIAARALCGAGNNVAIGGFVISGTQDKRVLLRAVGPTLTTQGIGANEVLEDPKIALHDARRGNLLVASNDNWRDNANAAEISATGARLGLAAFEASDTTSSALLVTLQPGVYTFVASGKASTAGVALIEIYEVENSQP